MTVATEDQERERKEGLKKKRPPKLFGGLLAMPTGWEPLVYTVDPQLCVCQTFVILLLFAASEKVDDVFWVGNTVHKLLTEARSVERLKASAVVHLRKAVKMMHLCVLL